MLNIRFQAPRARMAPGLPEIPLPRTLCIDCAPRLHGFSLTELVIVVALVAILAAIAYPSFIAYKVRANRSAAQSFLIDLANRQQLHFLDARTYTTNLAQLGANPIPPEVASYYVIVDPVVDNRASPPGFTLVATARAGTMQARDGDLAINSVGARSGHW